MLRDVLERICTTESALSPEVGHQVENEHLSLPSCWLRHVSSTTHHLVGKSKEPYNRGRRVEESVLPLDTEPGTTTLHRTTLFFERPFIQNILFSFCSSFILFIFFFVRSFLMNISFFSHSCIRIDCFAASINRRQRRSYTQLSSTTLCLTIPSSTASILFTLATSFIAAFASSLWANPRL